eukprot:7561335-Pyramimonas_sp.AAC.1
MFVIIFVRVTSDWSDWSEYSQIHRRIGRIGRNILRYIVGLVESVGIFSPPAAGGFRARSPP